MLIDEVEAEGVAAPDTVLPPATAEEEHVESFLDSIKTEESTCSHEHAVHDEEVSGRRRLRIDWPRKAMQAATAAEASSSRDFEQQQQQQPQQQQQQPQQPEQPEQPEIEPQEPTPKKLRSAIEKMSSKDRTDVRDKFAMAFVAEHREEFKRLGKYSVWYPLAKSWWKEQAEADMCIASLVFNFFLEALGTARLYVSCLAVIFWNPQSSMLKPSSNPGCLQAGLDQACSGAKDLCQAIPACLVVV